jgi:hypothetical protein
MKGAVSCATPDPRPLASPNIVECMTCEVPRAWTAHSSATIGGRSYPPKMQDKNPQRFMRRSLCLVNVSRL